jgi:cell division septal protein FtsQ
MIKFRSAAKHDVPKRRQNAEFVRPAASVEQNSQFRRNQTLSGVKRESEPVSERSRMHRLAKRRRNVSAIFTLVIIAIVVLGALLSQFTGKVNVTGSSAALNRAVQPSPYEKIITEYLAIHPVERLRFSLNQDALSSYVSDRMPEVSYVKLSGTSNVVESDFTLTFRKPVAGWQINGRQYYVDDSGVVFQANYYANPPVQIIDQSGVSPEQGSVVASARLLSFVGRVVSLSGQGSYVVTQAILPTGTTRQLDIKLEGVVPLVKLSIDRRAGEQVEDMIRALNYLKSKNISPQYVDVRVENRAAYK